VLLVYSSTHFVISRISVKIVENDWGLTDEFLYLPVHPDSWEGHPRSLGVIHDILQIFFYPIWKLDHAVLGGPVPMQYTPLRTVGDPQHVK
jgi:hypothetical protein